MQVMRRRRQNVTRMGLPALRFIFCGGPGDATGDMRILCKRDEGVAWLLCTKVGDFIAHLQLADKANEFMSWKEHGCKWTESLMAIMVRRHLKGLFAMVGAVSFRAPAKVKLFVLQMIMPGEDGYARRNHRLIKIMQLPPGDRRITTYSVLRRIQGAIPRSVREAVGYHPRYHSTRLKWPRRAVAQGACRPSCNPECHGLAR